MKNYKGPTYPVDSAKFLRPKGVYVLSISPHIYSEDEIREAFLECSTEYEAAMRFVSHWEHWKQIMKSKHFSDLIVQWREEKEHKDKTEQKKLLQESAKKGNVSAQKILFEYQDAERRKAAEKKAKAESKTAAEKAAEKRAELLNARLAQVTKLTVAK